MEKLYERIDFVNDTVPALNDTNLNAMSKAIDDLDDRVILIAGDVLVTVPQLQQMMEHADEIMDALEQMSQNPPYIGANGNWYVFNTSTLEYEDSGVDASITVTIADVTAIAPDAAPYVTNTGTDTDPVFHLFIPKGQNGATGADGVSPSVTITPITGGTRVTITDKDHPTGQSFDVMDGAGSGDMKASVYDANSAVATAGGIAAYVAAYFLDKATYADSNGNVPVSKGGTGSSSASDARTALGLGAAAVKSTTSSVTQGSGDLVESGAVYSAIEPVKGVFTSPVSAAIGATSATITDAAILTTSVIDPYCETASGNAVGITNITITTGQAVLTFGALTEAASFKLWIR